MNNSMKSSLALGLLSLSSMLVSCASTGSAPAAAPVAPPSPAQQAALAAAASRAAPEFPGFTLTVRRGEELYCQKRNPTGSRARMVEICHTRDQMLKMAENNADFWKQAEAGGSHDTLRTDSPR